MTEPATEYHDERDEGRRRARRHGKIALGIILSLVGAYLFSAWQSSKLPCDGWGSIVIASDAKAMGALRAYSASQLIYADKNGKFADDLRKLNTDMRLLDDAST